MSLECDAPFLQADGGVRGAGGGHADNERHLGFAGAALPRVSNRDVTICMESVNDETFTVTGYGWLLLMVTGICAVSDHVDVFRRRDGHAVDEQDRAGCAPSAIIVLLEFSPPNACRAMMVWAFVELPCSRC